MNQSVFALVVIGLMCVLFITRALPNAVISMLAAMAMAAAGIISFNDILSQYGTSTVFCVLGMMVVGGTLYDSGLATLAGEVLLRRAAGSQRVFTSGLILLTFLFSMFLSNTTVSAIFIPLTTQMALSARGRLRVRDSVIWIGFASTLGGCATLVGSPTQHLMAQELLSKNGYQTMPFFYGLRGSLLLLAVMVGFYFLAGQRITGSFSCPEPSEPEPPSRGKERNGYRMVLSALILAGSITLIATGVVSSGAGALIGAVACVALGVTSLDRALKRINWSIVMMLGALLAVSKAFDASGAGELCVRVMTRLFGAGGGALAFAAALAAAMVLTNVVDNIATQALVAPIALELAVNAGLDPRAAVFCVLAACNIAYATPISTPCISMTLSGGYRFTDYLKLGAPLSVISFAALLLGFPLLYGL